MNAKEAAFWVMSHEDNFVLLGNKVMRGSIYAEYTYIPLRRVNDTFYHIKYEKGEAVIDYTSPVYVDDSLTVID